MLLLSILLYITVVVDSVAWLFDNLVVTVVHAGHSTVQ
jgi:hypothetical protein